MGNSCGSASCLPEKESTMDLEPISEMVQDVTHLDRLISIIEERLNAIATENNRAQQNTSTPEVGSSSMFDSCTNIGKDLVEKMLKRAERNRCVVCFKSGYNRETWKVVIEVLKGASQIQLLAAGVCVVGYLLEQIQIQQLSDKREQCVGLLRLLCALARRVKRLDHNLPAETEQLKQAVNFIFEGCVLCLTQMKSHRLSRPVDAGDLQNFESQIRNTYGDLNLGVLNNNPRFLPPTQGQDPKPVGIEVAKDRVIRLLKMDPTDHSKRAVVIYGLGGIGKTTLATAVFKSLDLKAYKFCRIDMDQNCSNVDIKQLQQQMLRDLFEQKIELRSYVEGQDHLTQAFGNSRGRIFMFIDNALAADDLFKLLPTDLSCFPSGMRILLTTRMLDQTDMLLRTDCERIPFVVDALSSSDSKKLLCKIALGSANASLPPGIESIDVEEIVKMCDGIPLLVELVGHKLKKYLSRTSEVKVFKEFLKQSVVIGGDIERVVDEVYQSLDELSKEAFLDLVCFFDKRLRKEVSLVVGRVQLEVLWDAALVKPLDDGEQVHSFVWGTVEETPQFYLERYMRLKVNERIKARGRWLSQPDRIFDLESFKDALQDTQKLQKIKGIAISASEVSDEIEIKAESLNIMHSSLRVLSLPKSIKVNGICQGRFENLKYLEMEGNLPIHLKQLKRLAVLKLADSDNIDELPASLRFLSLRNAGNLLTLLQNFHNLSYLQYLDLQCCDALVRVPTSFGQLVSLIELDLSRCRNLTTLPQNIESLSSLRVLNVSHCTKLTSLPPTFGQLKYLAFLKMRECSAFTFLPDSLGNLPSLQVLYLNECKELVALPKSFGNLSALKLLNLDDCSNLKSLPESFGQLSSLKILYMSNCVQVSSLPDNFEDLKSLEFLSIDGCKNLKMLNRDFRALTSLRILWTMGIELRKMNGSRSLIQQGEQIGQRYTSSIVTDDEIDDYDDGFLRHVEHTLFHGGSKFVGVKSDGGQLVDWSWSYFEGEEEEEQVEVEVCVLLTMRDLSLDCNKSTLQIVRKEIERRMEESRGGRKFQIVYAEAGDSVEKSEEHIRQTLLKLFPTCTCACMPANDRTRQQFASALYSLLKPKWRNPIQSLHTCIFGLRVGMQRDKKWAKFQSECFPNDEKERDEWETLRDEGGGFSRVFSTPYFIHELE